MPGRVRRKRGSKMRTDKKLIIIEEGEYDDFGYELYYVPHDLKISTLNTHYVRYMRDVDNWDDRYDQGCGSFTDWLKVKHPECEPAPKAIPKVFISGY